MSCSFHRHLSPYLDGELDSLKTKRMKEHLKACVVCREELNLMLQIRNSLKDRAASTKAPPLLKEKILGEVHQAHRMVLIPRWNFAHGGVLAATLLLAFILIVYYWQAERASFSNVFASLIESHLGYKPGGRPLTIRPSGSQDIESWLENQMGFKALIPNAAFAGYRLEGADIFEQKGRKFAYLKYQQEEKTIGYVIFRDFGLSIDLPETLEVGEIQLRLGRRKEINLAAWKKRGLIYVILTTEDRSEVLEYAGRCIQLS